MPSKEEIKAIQQRFDNAVDEFFKAMGWGEDMVTTSWGLVGHQTKFDETGDTVSSYPIVYARGQQPDHILIGLFTMGVDIVRGINRYYQRDDDSEPD